MLENEYQIDVFEYFSPGEVPSPKQGKYGVEFSYFTCHYKGRRIDWRDKRYFRYDMLHRCERWTGRKGFHVKLTPKRSGIIVRCTYHFQSNSPLKGVQETEIFKSVRKGYRRFEWKHIGYEILEWDDKNLDIEYL